ncbi:osmotically-inducible protein OsmY [Pontibacter ummariensis]|uniref:Osmotically-inducible protein OsmY, contains BON domain n=1 Tax=Pontibacter ummariensis TaxID=1610492 RepID=A0A239JY65_9BACT|nr:BON domain-containing protein [Pontibacter ummariensis]PRY07270.1 osmotically-inducible protein OsmY [Pontibacter ummariensis]SNT10781.1 Osmotically-inducible protein OsmY, contains BON domain [Pontibacter ummariensis]
MRTDAQIQQDVMAQIKWNPLLNATEIGVAVKDGVVTLSGRVDTYEKKLQAEKEATRVVGVKALAEDIQVGVSPGSKKTDAEIAAAVVHALKWHTSIPDEQIRVKVEEGVVTLEGEVEWAFEREAARNAVIHLTGVKTLLNFISLKPKTRPADLKQRIHEAFQRAATLDAEQIQVEISGTKAVLRGYVRSFAEKEDAEKAVWRAPGILFVENKLRLREEPELSFWPN